MAAFSWRTVLLLLLQLICCFTAASMNSRHVKSGCRHRCGNVSIPYPFGIGAPGCFREGFDITCNHSIPYLSHGNLHVVEINLPQGLLIVNHYIAHDCYNENGSNHNHNEPWIDILGRPNYKFSHLGNKFMAVGCDTIGYIWNNVADFWTGCLSYCRNSSYVPTGTCSGIGCCTASIPKGLQNFSVAVESFHNHTNCWNFSPCGYGFLASEGWLNFTFSNLTSLRDVTMAPVTLDWAIMGETCERAQGNKSTYACVSQNSYCSNSTNGPGYLCNCSQGFRGNPYLEKGCQDIDECAAANPPCVDGMCKNTDGGYSCSCPWHMYGDGRVNGSGCRSILKVLYLILGGVFVLAIAIFIASWLYCILKRKRLIELKQKFFQQNGGLLLNLPSTSLEGGSSVTKLFSSEELQAATDNYKPSRILGEGGTGTVYKAVLPDQTVVAIKKSKVPADLEIEQFINEVNLLSHMNHRNVVKLLGCCLEEKVPMLVYEFVSNGTLSHHIHHEGHKGSLSLDNRLRIASEVAGALSYLHSAACIPIIHRDVKSTNILLDENLTAKVSDFGASKLVPIDQNGLVSLVRGTLGYLDPEYFHSGHFTDKSDVYSFGVVLVELLTGEKPVDKTRPVDCRSLAAYFMLSVNGGRLFESVEDRVLAEGTPELLVAVAELAKRCLNVKREERPSMKEVAMELEWLRRSNVHPWSKEHEEEGEHLLREANQSATATSPALGDYDSSVHGMVPFSIIR